MPGRDPIGRQGSSSPPGARSLDSRPAVRRRTGAGIGRNTPETARLERDYITGGVNENLAVAYQHGALIYLLIGDMYERFAFSAPNDPESSSLSTAEMLRHERKANLFMMGRRLHDLYRFGLRASNWEDNAVAAQAAGTVFPISNTEIESNPEISR
jgi:hypothetical protein